MWLQFSLSWRMVATIRKDMRPKMRASALMTLGFLLLATPAGAQITSLGKSPPRGSLGSLGAGPRAAPGIANRPYTNPYIAPEPTYTSPRRQAPLPEGRGFRPYGDRSGMTGGGPGAYPSAPKPRGYIDIYGDKPSEHPFAF